MVTFQGKGGRPSGKRPTKGVQSVPEAGVHGPASVPQSRRDDLALDPPISGRSSFGRDGDEPDSEFDVELA